MKTMLPVTLKRSSPDTQVKSRIVLRFGITSNIIAPCHSGLYFTSKGIQAFLRETVKNCSKNGFVKTLLGRKRFLPGIKAANMYIKSHVSFFIRPLQNDWKNSFYFLLSKLISSILQAERQAVNTTVQGSAADIVKLATINIQRRLEMAFPDVLLSHQHYPSGTGKSFCLKSEGELLRYSWFCSFIRQRTGQASVETFPWSLLYTSATWRAPLWGCGGRCYPGMQTSL